MRSSWAMIFLVVVLVAVAGYALHLDRHDKMTAAAQTSRSGVEDLRPVFEEGYRVEVCVQQIVTGFPPGDLYYTWVSGKRTIASITWLRPMTDGKWCDIFFVPLANSPQNVRVAVKPKELIKSFSYRYRLVAADHETEWTEKTEVLRYGDGMYPLAISQPKE